MRVKKNTLTRISSNFIALLLTLLVLISGISAQQSEADINARITMLTVKIRAAPKGESLYDQRGMAYYTLGKLDEALVDVNTAIGINPKNTHALYRTRSDQRSQK